MKFPDYFIQKHIEEGKIKISPPFQKHHLRPVGLRVHLGDEIFLYEVGQTVDLSQNILPKHVVIDISKRPYSLKPGEFVLAHTQEKIWTAKNILCQLDGRSTIARFGLSIHNTCQIADGTQNQQQPILLEITNHSSLTCLLSAGVPIGCVTFEQIAGHPETLAGVNVERSVDWRL